MTKVWPAAVIFALFAGELPAAAPLSRASLHKLCGAYADEPAGREAQACVAYVQGYLDGLRSEAEIEPRLPDSRGERETWSERAARTRLGRSSIERATQRERLCVPDSVPVSAIIEQLVAFLDAHPHRREAPAAEAIAETLRLHHACTR